MSLRPFKPILFWFIKMPALPVPTAGLPVSVIFFWKIKGGPSFARKFPSRWNYWFSRTNHRSPSIDTQRMALFRPFLTGNDVIKVKNENSALFMQFAISNLLSTQSLRAFYFFCPFLIFCPLNFTRFINFKETEMRGKLLIWTTGIFVTFERKLNFRQNWPED